MITGKGHCFSGPLMYYFSALSTTSIYFHYMYIIREKANICPADLQKLKTCNKQSRLIECTTRKRNIFGGALSLQLTNLKWLLQDVFKF